MILFFSQINLDLKVHELVNISITLIKSSKPVSNCVCFAAYLTMKSVVNIYKLLLGCEKGYPVGWDGGFV